jgi:potassium-dependent mechanosensitive channel
MLGDGPIRVGRGTEGADQTASSGTGTRMRISARLAWPLVVWITLLAAGTAAFAQPATEPQRPFRTLVELWTRQLDRIAVRVAEASLLPAEIDALRDQTVGVRDAAVAAVALARRDLADTKKLLAPLEIRPGADAPVESEAVKLERQQLAEQATVSEGRVKQGEVVIARADQLLERMTKLRGEVVLQTLLHRSVPPLSAEVWPRLGPELTASVQSLSTAVAAWRQNGAATLASDTRGLAILGIWAVFTLALWWAGGTLRRHFGRGDAIEPGQRDRTFAAAIDGVGLVLVPVLAVWLIGRLLAASSPPPPLASLVPEIVVRVIVLLLILGLTSTALAPRRPAWRVLPFTDASAHHLSQALRRLMLIVVAVDVVYLTLSRGSDTPAVTAFGALVLTTVFAVLALPTFGNRAWQAAASGAERPPLIGGIWWSIGRAVLSLVIVSSIGFALAGYATLAAHLHAAIFITCFLIVAALLLHRLAADLFEVAAAPETSSGIWVRQHLGLAPDSALRGHYLVLLLFDTVLVVLLAIAIPTAWGVDIDAILQGFSQLMHGVTLGGITISLGNVGTAIIAFGVCMLLARLVRSIVRDRVMPTVDASVPLRQSIDAGLNYAGVIIAILVGVGSLGIDFTNLAIVIGALSVGIGLGLQNIANNVISGVILLMERPIKAGDWVVVDGHEGFVRRINIRATEIETFQRASVIIPNSMFLQSAVINRTYADTSSRVEIAVTVDYGSDVAKVEAILREAALGHPRVLRVPASIVRFNRLGSDGLEFDLFAFVSRLEDRLVVGNELNRAILEKFREAEINIPFRTVDVHLRGIEALVEAIRSATAMSSAGENKTREIGDGTPPPKI